MEQGVQGKNRPPGKIPPKLAPWNGSIGGQQGVPFPGMNPDTYRRRLLKTAKKRRILMTKQSPDGFIEFFGKGSHRVKLMFPRLAGEH